MSDPAPPPQFPPGTRCLRFEDFELDLHARQLRRAGRAVHLEPKLLDLLVLLASRPGLLVSREAILASVWEDVHVTGWVVDRGIRLIRRALGDDGRSQRIVQTVRGRGFRFVAEVEAEAARLPDEGPLARALAAAATAGEAFVADPIAEMLDQPREAVAELLREAHEKGWLVEEDGRGGRMRFADPAVEEQLRRGVTNEARGRWLARLAEWEARRDPTEHPVERLAQAYRAGAPCGEALARHALARAAAEQALGDAEAADRSLEQAEQALADRGLAADAGRRWRLGLARARLRIQSGDPEAGRAIVAKALRAAREADDGELFAAAAVARDLAEQMLGGTHLFAAETLDLLDEAWERTRGGAAAVRGPVRSAQARRLFYVGRRAEAAACAREALALADAAADGRLRGDALTSLYYASWEPTKLAERTAIAARLIEEAQSVSDHAMLYLGHLFTGFSRGESADMEGVHAALRELEHLRAASPAVSPSIAWMEQNLRRMMLLARGELAKAEGEILTALEQGRRGSRVDAYALLTAQLHQLRSHQGRLEEVLPSVEEVPRRFGRPWAALVAATYGALGRIEEAAQEITALVRDSVDILDRSVNAPFLTAMLAEACRATRMDPPASELYERLLPLEGHHMTLRPSSLSLGSADRYLGLLAWAAGQHERAERHLEAAQLQHRSAGLRPWTAVTAVDLAELLAERAEEDAPPRVEAALREAEAIAADVGMQDLLGRVATLRADRESLPPAREGE